MGNWTCDCTGELISGMCICEWEAAAKHMDDRLRREARLALRGTERPGNPTTGHKGQRTAFGAELED